MLMKAIAVACPMVLITTALSVAPADAAKKKRYQYRSDTSYYYRAQPRYRYSSEPPSLDGRVTGRPRTCGFDLLQYDGTGDILGPLCH